MRQCATDQVARLTADRAVLGFRQFSNSVVLVGRHPNENGGLELASRSGFWALRFGHRLIPLLGPEKTKAPPLVVGEQPTTATARGRTLNGRGPFEDERTETDL
jgi:hypothetical protein